MGAESSSSDHSGRIKIQITRLTPGEQGPGMSDDDLREGNRPYYQALLNAWFDTIPVLRKLVKPLLSRPLAELALNQYVKWIHRQPQEGLLGGPAEVSIHKIIDDKGAKSSND